MVNKITLLGNLGQDIEIITFDNGNRIAKTSLATTEYWKDKKTGEKKAHTEWHNLVFSGNLVDLANKYLQKGSKLYVEGKVSYRNYEKDGEKRYFTEIAVRDMKFLDPKQSNSADQNHKQTPKSSNKQESEPDDFPF